MTKTCELYKYNPTFYATKRDEIGYFASDFLDTELDDDHVCWLNIADLSNHLSIGQLCNKLHIDKLSIENIYQFLRRPKVEEYADYMFFSVIFAETTLAPEENISQNQVTFFLGENYLLSFQNGLKGYFDDVRNRIEKPRGKIRAKKSDFLLYRCMEAIIDNYHTIIDDVILESTLIEARLHTEEDKAMLHDIEHQKKKLIQLRRIARPMRDVTEQLNSTESPFIEAENQRYFRNLNNSCGYVIEEIESQIQILDGMANFYYAAQGQRMNEIMRILTIVSAIFIPLTFIVGVYGMNFENIPELRMKNAYFVVLGVMISIGVTLFTYFLRRGWVKRSDYSLEKNKQKK
jgi:magnesium transporter